MKRLAVVVVLSCPMAMAVLTAAPALGSPALDSGSRFQETTAENGRCVDRPPFPAECGPRD